MQIHAARRPAGQERALPGAVPEEEGVFRARVVVVVLRPGHVRPRSGRLRSAAVSLWEEMHVSTIRQHRMKTRCIFIPRIIQADEKNQ